jgi:ribosomal 30S subunit maturation factor RimM
LPAIKDVIKKVDIEDKKVYVKLMEGLLWQSL